MSFLYNIQCKHLAAVYYYLGLLKKQENKETNNKILSIKGRNRNYKAGNHGKKTDIYPSFDGTSNIKKPGKKSKMKNK